jgi:hypothetical protein
MKNLGPGWGYRGGAEREGEKVKAFSPSLLFLVLVQDL